ncbi:MAG: SusC/RagA family protein, partial [Muribaculaceae bacterium]|nr:SusC/RagA family protein [Muribaculaceae bacterium]
GWEIEIGGSLLKRRDLTWRSTLNLSHNSGKIKKLGMEGQYIEYAGFPNPGTPGNAVRITSGSPLGKFFVYRYAGVDENGQIQIYDKDNNVVLAQGNALNSNNKTWVGNAFPAIIATWNNTVRYKDFDFGMQLRGWFDFDVMSQPSMYMGLSMGGGGNNLVKKLYEQNQHIKGDKVLCDYFISDGTFVKIDAINFGYTLNTAKWTNYLQKARFYVTLRDVARFTSYKGINPEVNINGLEPGFEKLDGSSLYPQTLHATFGVQLTF